MRLRNLKIEDCDIPNKSNIIDGIKELDIIISDNYKESLQREIFIEYNIASTLDRKKEYLIIYVNPSYKNNPYIFILKMDNNQSILTSKTDLSSFRKLADMSLRQDINKMIYKGFERLPKHAFLSEAQIKEVRERAKQFDECER